MELKKDISEARFWFQKSEVCKASSESEFTEAFTWFFRAAEQGHRKAQYYLGTLYATGKGITKDNMKAYSWFSVAMPNEASTGEPKIDEPKIGEPRAEGAMKKIKKNFTSDELSEAIKASEELSGSLRNIKEENESGSMEMVDD